MRRETHVRRGVKRLIHPTAIVSEKAEIAKDVHIGPYTIIGSDVRLGRGTHVGPRVVIEGKTTLGENNQVYAGAVLGLNPQIQDFKEENTSLEIGSGNVIREYVTIHRGSKKGSKTRIGNNNYFMVQSHIAHDCRIGNQVMLANGVGLAGHVEIGHASILGGLTGVHQFCRIGAYVMLGGLSRVSKDVVPYALAEGNPVTISGVNLVGLKRANFSEKTLRAIKSVYRKLFFSKTLLSAALQNLSVPEDSAEVKELVQFIQGSKRGIAARG